jgi:hypothetical protein
MSMLIWALLLAYWYDSVMSTKCFTCLSWSSGSSNLGCASGYNHMIIHLVICEATVDYVWLFNYLVLCFADQWCSNMYWHAIASPDDHLIISGLWISGCPSLWLTDAHSVLFVLPTDLVWVCWCLSKHQWLCAMIPWIICKTLCISSLSVSFICLICLVIWINDVNCDTVMIISLDVLGLEGCQQLLGTLAHSEPTWVMMHV